MSNRLPTYSLRKATGQARVWFQRKDHHLGTYGSEESRARYAEPIQQNATGVAVDPLSQRGRNDIEPTINELAAAYRIHAHSYYQKRGKVTAEYHCIVSAIRPMLDLFGDSPAAKFGPAALKAVRQRMVDSGTIAERGFDVRLAWSRRSHGRRFDGRQPEHLTPEDWKALSTNLMWPR